MRRLGKYALAAAAAAALIAGRSARADSYVSFTSTASFDANGSGDSVTSSGNTITLTSLSGESELSYTPATGSWTNIDITPVPPTFLTLGNFSATSTDTSLLGDSFGTATFDISIDQTAPPEQNGDEGSSGTITGTITSTHSGITITYNPAVITFVTGDTTTEYNLLPTTVGYTGGPGSPATGTFQVNLEYIGAGAPPVTPLPASVFGGAGLFGLVGLRKLRNAKLA